MVRSASATPSAGSSDPAIKDGEMEVDPWESCC